MRYEGRVADVMPGTSEALLAGLDPEQREVAVAARGPVCVLAGAGTGKTRAITYRIAYAALSGTVDPAHVLALTFTVRAAGELRGRLRQLGVGQVRASTFHAAALRQLNYFWPRVVGGRPPQLIDSKAGLVREAAKRALVRLDGTPGALADTAAEIEWAKVIQVRPDAYAAAAAAAGRSAAAGADNLAAVYTAYEELRRERHLIDFESVLELTAAILLDSRAAAARAPADAHRVPRRRRGGGRAGQPGPGAHRGRGAVPGDRRPGPGQRRHRAVRAGAGRSRPALRHPRCRALLRTARGPPGAGAAPRGRPGRGSRRFR